jgi:predicted metal-dependent hydrolase
MSITIIADLPITLVTKRIRNLNLRISPPDGRITVSVPHGYPTQRIEAFLRSKSGWIRKHQERIRNAPYVPPLRFESGEEHLFLGEKYRLIIEKGKKKCIEIDCNIIRLQDYKNEVWRDRKNNVNPAPDLFEQRFIDSDISSKHRSIMMTVTPRMSKKEREGLMDEWYRARMKEIVPQLLEKYHALMPVRCQAWGIKKMRTKWGTCNTRTKKVWISLMLAKKPLSEIEHVVVHELVHLMERKHSKRFHLLVKEFLTKGKCYIEDGGHSVD